MNPVSSAAASQKPETKSRVEDAKLKEACEQFEGMFLTQLVTAMRATTFKSDIFGHSQEEEMYQSMFNEQLAQMLAHQDNGGLGLANLLYQQITGHEM